MYSTLDNIRTELKQSIGYTGSKGRLRKYLQIMFAYTCCGVNRRVQMERQDHIPSQGQRIERDRLHSRLYIMMTPRQTEDKIRQVPVL